MGDGNKGLHRVWSPGDDTDHSSCLRWARVVSYPDTEAQCLREFEVEFGDLMPPSTRTLLSPSMLKPSKHHSQFQVKQEGSATGSLLSHVGTSAHACPTAFKVAENEEGSRTSANMSQEQVSRNHQQTILTCLNGHIQLFRTINSQEIVQNWLKEEI